MKILAPHGLHIGVFHLLNETCHHTFSVPRWSTDVRPKPSCVIEEPLNYDGDYDCILVQSIGDWNEIPNKERKPIIYYDLMNGRGVPGPAMIYNHRNTILAYVSNSCRISHGIYEQVPHYVLYPGIDENAWGFDSYDGLFDDRSRNAKIVHARNDFSKRDVPKYNDYLYLTRDMPSVLIGAGGDKVLNLRDMNAEYWTSRVYVNVEIATSTFSIATMEAMMAGLPIVSNNVEGSADYIKNGINGYVGNNLPLLRKHIEELLNNKELAISMGNESRKIATLMFGKKQFNANVNYLFDNLESLKR